MKSQIALSSSTGRRVLMVEDELRLRDLLLRAVTGMGFECTALSSAEAALRLLENQPIDIVMLDLNLPGMDGLEFFEIIRRRYKHVQVIVLTGFGDLDAAKRAIHLDVVDFLTKPCALGDLEVALERARSRRVQLLSPHAVETPAEAPVEEPERTNRAAGDSLEEVERAHILGVLARHDGNRADTAAELGISLRTLYYRLGQYQKEGKTP